MIISAADVALRWQCFPKPDIIRWWHILLHSEWKVNRCLTLMFSFLQLTERLSVSPLPLFSYPAGISGILFVKPLAAGLICHSPLAEPLPLPGLSPMGVMVLPFYLLLCGRIILNNETKKTCREESAVPHESSKFSFVLVNAGEAKNTSSLVEYASP